MLKSAEDRPTIEALLSRPSATYNGEQTLSRVSSRPARYWWGQIRDRTDWAVLTIHFSDFQQPDLGRIHLVREADGQKRGDQAIIRQSR